MLGVEGETGGDDILWRDELRVERGIEGRCWDIGSGAYAKCINFVIIIVIVIDKGMIGDEV